MFPPSPQLRRAAFHSLDGEWTVSVNGAQPVSITVPYPPEVPLSGVAAAPCGVTSLRYQKSFPRPAERNGGRVLLHFGAVDQEAEVFLNGHRPGSHRGGYEAFSFDLTPYLQEENHLTVEVMDRPEDAVLPYGKQGVKRGGMWYTPVSGIWQTVRPECVPTAYIRALRTDTALSPDLTSAAVRITAEAET